MALPWLQIVQLVPSILDVSRELMRRTRGGQPAPANAETMTSDDDLLVRIAALEENERRQAELVGKIAEQLAVLSRAVTALHQRVVWLTVGLIVAIAAAGTAIVIAV